MLHSVLTLCSVTELLSIVFTGKDASRALAKTSLKQEDCSPVWEDLDDKEKGVLKDWYTFFSKRYSVVGTVGRDASNEK